MTSPHLADLLDTIRGMERKPRDLMARWQDNAENDELNEEDLLALIADPDPNADARVKFHIALGGWDDQSQSDWSVGTEPGSEARRVRIMEKLKLSAEAGAQITALMPSLGARDTLIARTAEWDPWYTEDRRALRHFYWDAYRDVLRAKGWMPESINGLNRASNQIVERLADPAGQGAYQSKGLVVGHVQSGKTANFTATIAKAIDAGYRLIIVLTGTVEILRGQTQRRLDMELIGAENILGGADPNDPDAIKDIDYVGKGDDDWDSGKFLKHGVDIVRVRDIPGIKRLTTMSGDYKSLKSGLDALDFQALQDPSKPVFAPENLFPADVRIAIVKKNRFVLDKLLRDLQNLHADLREIPTLIIDDEADQASVNTRPVRKNGVYLDKEDIERTAINKLLKVFLDKMPRAQYLAYTATPFANVFVSPDDSKDVFPSDFILALEPPAAYMGGSVFHDLDRSAGDDEPTYENSGEAAFARDISAFEDEEAAILRALDMFVLSGAVKLWREKNQPEARFRHHTMLAHVSQTTAEHEKLKALIEAVWYDHGFTSPGELARLSSLFDADVRPVHAARGTAKGNLLPVDFGELEPFIGAAVAKITSTGSPVVVVNGTKESDYKAADFQSGEYWRVMVGGAKLSRGFTVEGLTVSYFRRKSQAADTLMQMGRWFGYRPGYEDLVRLYIDRAQADAKGKIYDLYDAFTTIVQDEERFRERLAQYSALREDGRPKFLPRDVPPMVFQQLPWLKPTATNKMYNAVLVREGQGGLVRDLNNVAPADGSGSAISAILPWFAGGVSRRMNFTFPDRPSKKRGTFDAAVVMVTTAQLTAALEAQSWMTGFEIGPTIRFLEAKTEDGLIEDWAVLAPYMGRRAKGLLIDGFELPLSGRTRRVRPGRDYGDFTGSGIDFRPAAQRIAGLPEAREKNLGGPTAEELSTPTRGAVLLAFVREDEPTAAPKGTDEVSSLVPLFSIVSPYDSAPRGDVGFQVRLSSDAGAGIVDKSDD
ncbi:Z1 domain-containing protein [Rathayibacter festucae]|uniref:Z1 domain-containing protein n=1 Tax=Rathayibacter festucae TaxID=110937 RepID=UPI002A69E6B2|nr:Z1 domain-containing protein [Rathayibacter festucae]MDY0912865.1 Z1 domain-containing protein [Rathayibacter festucae]